MTYQRASEVPKGFDTSYEDTIASVLRHCNVAFMRHPVYCYACKSVFENPHGPNKAPSGCKYCHVVFDGPEQYCLPDFRIYDNATNEAFIFVHGSIHFKDEKRRKHDYRIYQELLSHDFKCFVIKNETIETATWSVLFAWVMLAVGCMRDNKRYLALYSNEKELGYLQRAILERYQ